MGLKIRVFFSPFVIMRAIVVCVCLATALGTGPRLPVPEFEVNLDLAPEERFTEVVQHFNSSLQNFIKYLHADNFIVKGLAKALVKRRGPENDELQAEVRGMAKLLNIPESELQAIQMLYELNTLMIPLVNLTGAVVD